MGQKVIYVDCEGTRFDAEIVGPVAEIHKPKLKSIGKDQFEVVTPGQVVLKPGVQLVSGQTARENRTRPYVNLRVNFGTEARPRCGDVTGVRLKSELDTTYRKAYYEPVDEAAEEPAPAPKSEAAPATAEPAAEAPKAAPKPKKAKAAPKPKTE